MLKLQDDCNNTQNIFYSSKNQNKPHLFFFLHSIEQSSIEYKLIFLKMLIILAIFLSICYHNNAQVLATSNLTSILIFPQLELQPYIDTSTPSNQTNNVISFVENNDYIYVLSTNNAIQVLQKANPNIVVSNMLQFYQSTHSNITILLNLLINDVGEILIAIGLQNNSILVYYFFQTGKNLQFLYKKEIGQIPQIPFSNFFANSQICSFLSSSLRNDSLLCLNYSDNYTYSINLSSINSSISISPDQRYAIIWTRYAQLYIYQLSSNFTTNRTYRGSMSNQRDTTKAIRFIVDSKLFILQADNHHPISLVDIQNLSLVVNITNKGKTISAHFIDINNRFVLIIKPDQTIIYDMVTGESTLMNATLACDTAFEQQGENRIQVLANYTWTIYGVNITINGTLISGDYIYNPLSPSVSPTSPFYYQLNLTQMQNNTFQLKPATIIFNQTFDDKITIGAISIVMTDIAYKFNMVVFSSPLASFFLGFFNYFTLNSLYVLLDISLPKIIFDQFSGLYFALNQNMLDFFGVNFTISLNSAQLVDQQKPIYFGIKSDLIENNYYQISIFLVSLITIELFYLFRKIFINYIMIIKNIKIERRDLYFGLIISNIVSIVIPIKYFLKKTFPNVITKVNMAIQCLLIVIIFHYILSNLIIALQLNQKAKMKNKKNMKQALITFLWQKQSSKMLKSKQYEKLPDWFIAWQNFIYGLLVLIRNQEYFLTFIFISKIGELIINIRYSDQSKCIYTLRCSSLICEIIFHITFIIFACTNRDGIIIYNSIACLAIFWIGGLLNFIQVVIFVIKVIFQSFIKIKQFFTQNKVTDLPEIRKKKVNFKVDKIDSLVQESKAEFKRKDKRKNHIVYKNKKQFLKDNSVFMKKIKITFE